ncbi:MAG: pantoate--beta-alanine ligase [Verrucomicrobiota bacterium]|nr:pantoate--beta-alanine ligase [Verrucomicrobiota bacterium]
MKTHRTIAATSNFCRTAPRPVVLIPTMGALHRGHAALITRARREATPRGTVVVSLFVNPTQFGPGEDYSRYPRSFSADAKLCRDAGADLIFAPTPKEMYPADFSTIVEEEALSQPLCGSKRQGHFRGVCTVVAKLLHIVQPDAAVFGMKDFQQLAIVRRMVRDLNLPVEIVAEETVREEDGLAISSRNQYLTREQRKQATVIRSALLAAADKSPRTPAALRKLMTKIISQSPEAKIDYVEIVDPDTLRPAKQGARSMLIATAVFFGKTRLIDNILLR